MQNLWRIPASEIVYIGDNVSKDFQAPRQLGMQSVWFYNNDGIYKTFGTEDIYERKVDSISGMENLFVKE